MTKRMLIDATHAEETRVVVLEGNRLEDFDVETQSRKQLKGNIYLAKVVRVEPSLQAAFVEYGGNRHGFLAFGEIHPDYYQIPIADRQRLLQMQEDEARAEAEAEEAHERSASNHHDQSAATPDAQAPQPAAIGQNQLDGPVLEPVPDESGGLEGDPPRFDMEASAPAAAETPPGPHSALPAENADPIPEASAPSDGGEDELTPEVEADPQGFGDRVQQVPPDASPPPETIGGESDTGDEVRERRQQSRYLRSYKIQEVIRRRQILLIQVVKEERGTKGAALTTYISLAGRYCVLMPNSPRGGGISRKITSAADRRRLKEVTAELEIPRGMGLIVRTAGANRPKSEIIRDCEYLLRLWDDIREHTMDSVAPALIYEEANLIKRAIRDVYSRDVDELLIDGEEGWKAAREFMRMLMPSHVNKVQLWRNNGAPLFASQQVEAQLDAMLSPTVQLRSGGYLVINQAEALVAIDVNSGRSTRERGIEETALRTNLEAAEEAARQLRLRDLAGLIVIDFIDMESKKHNAMVERRLKEALKTDRARIQVGSISHFGLMEMSRQRLRPSLAETSLNVCPHCGGLGHVRSTESAALHILRAIEEEGGKRRAAEILVHVSASTALYILNNMRQRLTDIENRYGMRAGFAADESLLPAQSRIDRLRPQLPSELPPPVTQARPTQADAFERSQDAQAEEAEAETDDAEIGNAPEDGEDEADSEAAAGGAPTMGENGEPRRRRRRRRRGGRRDDAALVPELAAPAEGAEQPEIGGDATLSQPATVAGDTEDANESADPVAVRQENTEPPRQRGRRGGRRRRRDDEPAEPAEPVVGYTGPTPADPFATGGIDIFDVLERVETQQAVFAEPAIITEASSSASFNEPSLPAPAEPASVVTIEPPPSEPISGPLIQPTLIGAGEPVAEKRRGWWRKPAGTS